MPKPLETIRVCIGTEEKTLIPCKILEHSIRKHLDTSKYQVDFYRMSGVSWTTRTTSQGTGFSLQRWYIPEFFLFSGKAIYLDVDMLCFTDISELWNIDVNTKESKRGSIYCTFQKDKWRERSPATSAMLIDCEKAKQDWTISSSEEINAYVDATKDRSNYIKLMHADHVKSINEIPLKWNRFNDYVAEDSTKRINTGTSILHYTKEPEQPWYFPQHKFKDLWKDYLVECIENGVVSKAEIRKQCSIFKPHTFTERGQGLHPYWMKFARD